MTGGGGADVFSFGNHYGNDTITDFELGNDMIRFYDLSPDDVVFTENSKGEAVLRIEGFGEPGDVSGTILLEGVDASDLTGDSISFFFSDRAG